jgi:hypothetical protein
MPFGNLVGKIADTDDPIISGFHDPESHDLENVFDQIGVFDFAFDQRLGKWPLTERVKSLSDLVDLFW